MTRKFQRRGNVIHIGLGNNDEGHRQGAEHAWHDSHATLVDSAEKIS